MRVEKSCKGVDFGNANRTKSRNIRVTAEMSPDEAFAIVNKNICPCLNKVWCNKR